MKETIKVDNEIQTEKSSAAIIQPLYEVKGWMKFLGVIYMISGILACITIFGAITGWIPIWIGHLLMKTSKSLEDGYGNNNTGELKGAVGNIGLTIKLFGILTLIGLIINLLMICLMVLYVAFIIFVLGAGIAGAASGSGGQ